MTTTSSDTKTQAERLAEPFPDEAHKTMDKGGSTLTYIPVSEVISRLNNVLGVTGWEIVETSQGRDALDPDWVIAKCTLRAEIDGKLTQRIGSGGQKVKTMRNGGGPVDLGDEFKGADSDAFKKAAQGLGVGLYLARDEEMISFEAAAKFAPLKPEDRGALRSKLDSLSEEQAAAVASYWKSEKLPKWDSEAFREDHLETIVSFIEGLTSE